MGSILTVLQSEFFSSTTPILTCEELFFSLYKTLIFSLRWDENEQRIDEISSDWFGYMLNIIVLVSEFSY